MTGPNPSDGGDYGYDMAHDASAEEQAGRRLAPDPDPAHPHRSADRPDEGGDYGYDEAHGY